MNGYRLAGVIPRPHQPYMSALFRELEVTKKKGGLSGIFLLGLGNVVLPKSWIFVLGFFTIWIGFHPLIFGFFFSA